MEAISVGEWNPFTEMSSEEADFMAELLGNCSLPNEVPSSSDFAVSSTFWSADTLNLDIPEAGLWPLHSANEPENSLHSPYISHQFIVSNNNLMPIDYHSSWTNVVTTNVMEGDDFINLDVCNEKFESVPQGRNSWPGNELVMPKPDTKSKKRTRIHGEIPRCERNMKLKKCPKLNDFTEDSNNNNSLLPRPSSGNCFSEDNSNASHEMQGVTFGSSSKDHGALNISGKARTARGSATDPQSLYARTRRERINKRLRILQSLVPNGTKVDISTMLEEAVHYVKFLQLQIKMLSSDELWMYAPIIYNGMDIGRLI